MKTPQAYLWLKIMFLIGIIVDALAIVPMLIPSMAHYLWGLDVSGGAYRFAMYFGAALMLGWTLLLIWAYRNPIERRIVGPLTQVVLAGLAASEIAAICQGSAKLEAFLPTLIMQVVFIISYTIAYLTAIRKTAKNADT
jgi:hypothetical protein